VFINWLELNYYEVADLAYDFAYAISSTSQSTLRKPVWKLDLERKLVHAHLRSGRAVLPICKLERLEEDLCLVADVFLKHVDLLNSHKGESQFCRWERSIDK